MDDGRQHSGHRRIRCLEGGVVMIALIDLSGVFRRHWHATEHEEIGEAYRKTINDVRGMTDGADHVAICVDRPPYKRRELSPEYKANREKSSTVLIEQLRAIEEELARQFHVIGAKGYEADDIIATLAKALESDRGIMIYSADKDLMQLVNSNIRVKSTATWSEYGPAEVEGKFGVKPSQVADLLALIGDKSDNVAGIKGVGLKTAAKWLTEYGDLEGIMEAAGQGKLGRFSDKIDGASLMRDLELVTLMTDAPINPGLIFEPIDLKEEPVQDVTLDAEVEYLDAMNEPEPERKPEPNPEPVKPIRVVEAAMDAHPQETALAANVPREWGLALEPQSNEQAWRCAHMLYKSRMFGDWPNPEAIMAIVMRGRTMGIDAVTSLAGFHFVKGRPAMSAQMMIGLIKRNPMCEWFRFVGGDGSSATWETKHRAEPEPTRLTYTIQEAKDAGLVGGNWSKRPQTMLRWRCGTELARLVYPDVVTGLYTPDELRESA